MSDKNYAISRHVKKHDIDFNNYIKDIYTLVGNIIFEKCSFCERQAIPIYKINHNNLTYEITYENGYSCNTLDCKKQISLDILGIEYDTKKFEKIGSRSEYLSKLYKISISDSKKMKYNENKTNFFRCSLEGFIKKYGETEGKILYDSRVDKLRNKGKLFEKNLIKSNLEGFIEKFGKELGEKKYKKKKKKIAYTNTLDYYVNRFGKEEGELRYKNKLKQTTISKKSLKVNNILMN
jgi:hypothetical protein